MTATDDVVCTRCGLPATRRTVTLDQDTVCSVCRHHEVKHTGIDWAERAASLAALADEVRGRGQYDAVVPFGGGKDGAFVLYHLVRELGLRCLAVTVDNRFLRPRAWGNCQAVLDGLGVDQVIYRPPMPLVKRLMRVGLDLAGTVCWHCNAAIAAVPVRTALRLGVPLLVHAHSVAEYHSYTGRTYADAPTGDVVDAEWYEMVTGLTFDKVAAALSDVDPAELEPFRLPDDAEVRAAGLRTIFLSNYLRWDERRQVGVIEEQLGWSRDVQEGIPAGFEYEKIDCFLVGTRDYLRYIQEGYGRGARLGAMEVRLGRMSRAEAEALGRETDGRRPASLDTVLGMLAIDEEELLDAADAYTTPGREFDLESVRRGEPLPDAAAMPR
ncbi:N-acetyl sugar amidotransferase [Phytohabitans houttuyneae]|uniref:LPS biosynthesis protein n=1 Tax=Phytohabitans houttuyneae TaxID=1076126 RepID=A0A6V8K3C7_9ACTN|nr:N-acetyl sugar amidotransferase [Phytohabitans houttuyneae]GFJ78020.1 hypothetical protein Phou_022000 [Phytohabitans houttuyneae]